MIMSKYNHLYESDELNKSILINYLNGKMIIFKDDANKKVKELLSEGSDDPDISKYLYNHGYLIKKNMDEVNEITKIQNTVYENKDLNCNIK